MSLLFVSFSVPYVPGTLQIILHLLIHVIYTEVVTDTVMLFENILE